MNRGDSSRHKRHSIRLQSHDYSGKGPYFITVCSKDRLCILGEVASGVMIPNAAGRIVEAFWKELPLHFAETEPDVMVIMPNHVHFIVHIKDKDRVTDVGAIHELPLQSRQSSRNMLLPKIIGYFKMNSAKRINDQRGTPGIPVWQRNYYERVIRNEDELTRAREYIINNPLKWDLDRENPVNISTGRGISHIGECKGDS